MIAANFAIELIFNAHCAQLQVNIYRIRNTEAIDDTCVYGQSFAMRLCVVVSEPRTYIRNDLIYAVLVVSSKQRIQIEHHISVQIHIVETLFVVAVIHLSAFHVVSTCIIRISSCLKAAILQTYSQSRGEPFADGKIQRRTDTLAKTSCLIIISKSCFGTTAYREKPITPERISDYLIFILDLDNTKLFHNFSLLLRHGNRRHPGQSQ